jgi:hypothetical protein
MGASTSPARRHFCDGLKDPLRVTLALPFGSGNGRDHIHLAVDQCLAAFEMVYHDKAGAVEVTDFYGRDETLAHLSFACAEMLSTRTAGHAKRVAALAHLLAIHIAEKYTNLASQRPDCRGGLPIARLRKVEDYVRAHLAERISIDHFPRKWPEENGNQIFYPLEKRVFHQSI